MKRTLILTSLLLGIFIINDIRNAQHAQGNTGIQTNVDNPYAPVGDWQTATPQEVGMDPALFAAAMDTLPSPAVVIRNGRIVGQKGDIARAGHIWSGSKSVIALMFARLLQQGQIAHYDVVVPHSNVPSDPPATFRQFMSMTSDYNLSPHSPGNHYAYNNGGVHFYGTYLKNTFYPGRTEVQMLQESYGSALGFQDGLSFAGYLSGWDGGWSMSTRDLARIGYLVLKNGNWNGQQIIPAGFVNDLYTNQIPAAATQALGTDAFYNEFPATIYLPGGYSFGFWLPQHTSMFGGQAQTEATSMAGAFGTSMHISRSKDLIIVAVNTSPDVHRGGKISAATLDQFAASIIGPTPTPTPTPPPTPTPTPTPNPTPTPPPITGAGRIAISSDGNDHDCDDLTATAMSIALLAKSGNASRLVYYGYSDHIWSTGLDGPCNGGHREEEMRISSEETARLWGGFNLGVFINAKAHTTTAVAALTSQINASSAANPLWIIGSGPMEIIGRALSESDEGKRQYVTVVSHSEWNNYHAEEPGHGTWNFFELGSGLGANLRHLVDQNSGLRVHEGNYLWLQQSSDARLNWNWQRHLKSGLSPDFDPSDAGMIYWLITGANNGGDQNATPAKIRAMLEAAPAPTPTPTPTPFPTPTPTPTATPSPTPPPTGLITLSGGTFFPDGEAANYTTIVLADSNGVEIMAQQEQEATYQFTVPPGSYQLYVRQPGYNFNPSKIVFTDITSSYSGLNITMGSENNYPMGPIQYIPARHTAELKIEPTLAIALLLGSITYESEGNYYGYWPGINNWKDSVQLFCADNSVAIRASRPKALRVGARSWSAKGAVSAGLEGHYLIKPLLGQQVDLESG